VIAERWTVVGLDNGGTSNNATVLDASGRFVVDTLVELPSPVPTMADTEERWAATGP
jgi:predicted NBD/HSP70 family sugar kinase